MAERRKALNLYARWINPLDDSLITSFMQEVLATLVQQSKNQGLDYPFFDLNDAGPCQDIFSQYDYGESLGQLRQTRQKYDPLGVFQNLQPGGFKIGV